MSEAKDTVSVNSSYIKHYLSSLAHCLDVLDLDAIETAIPLDWRGGIRWERRIYLREWRKLINCIAFRGRFGPRRVAARPDSVQGNLPERQHTDIDCDRER